MSDARPAPSVPAPTPRQLRDVAARLHAVGPKQMVLPLEMSISPRALKVIAAGLETLAHMLSAPGREREALLEQRLEAVGELATSRRLPLAALEALVVHADREGLDVLSVDAIRQALAATEPRS